jgi:hypothetical protein
MKDSNAICIIFQSQMPLFILLMFSQLFTSCVVSNTFDPPKNLPNSDQIKRLIIFRASVVDTNHRINDTKKGWMPLYPIIVRQNEDKLLINLTQPLSGKCTYAFEIDLTDTGSIRFLMGPDRKLVGKNYTAIQPFILRI